MAAAPGLLFWLLLLGPPWRVPGHPEPDANRRFSEHKLCADDECSMLMYRGEALEDFTGPDCRFVNFKKGDHVYVYYKLAGGAPEVWAGTVGRNFGYFPKDFIRVAHEYIEEELKVPADETDFVCFDGGKDDFDNYNIEELLGFLKLPESATGDSGKAIEKTSQHVENPEVSEESDLDPAEANTEESESELSENTEELEERHASPKNPPHVNRQTDDPQGESSFDRFEEMLQEKLKVPESQNNKTSNSSQVANEQEQIDAYKLLKKEMTLDLKTKFGSTADALVSDDETTSLVTSLEDDFDEDLDDEYYIVGKEEEDQESFDELPLLTFTDEDLETPLESGAEKHSPDKEQNSSEEDNKAEVTQPPGIRHDATVTESEQISMDLENSSSEAEGSDDAFLPDGECGEPQLAADYVESEKAEDGLLIVHGLETNEDKDPELDAELGSKGKGRTGEGSQTDLPRSKKGPEDEKQEGGTPRGSAQSRDLDSLPAPGKDRAALTSTFGNKEGDLKGTVVSVSKETLHEEKPGEQLLEGGSDSGSERKAAGDPMKGERLRQESLGVTAPAPSGDDRHNASSQDPVEEEADVSVNGPEPQVLSEERQNEDPRTHNQPRSSSPGEVAGSRALGAQGAALGGSPAGHQARDVAAAEDRRASESSGLSAQRGAEAPGAPAPIPQAEGDDGDDGDDDDDDDGGGGGRGPAGLLEDENAASARRAGAEGRPRGPGGGAAHGDVEAGAGGDPGPGPGPRADPAAPRPADGEERRTLELGGALRGAQSGDRARRGPEGRPAPAPARAPAPSGLAQRPGDAGADLPIIRSFAKEEQALRRLQRLLDVRALEAMLQEMARRLRAAPRDSAPRGADTARDTAFRAAESQILRAAQAMLAARVDGRGGLGTEDSSAEAAAVLDDVQDLIYFVGYTHAAGEDTVPLAAAQPPEAEG
ncbi:transport and Golgi organization protein 1 homolog [Pteropus medius]|uniref:transport and Golgi organization protein 1 homolog n=1 Tax=Pteropus vampyrus TaxID=132908 RepID=UPI00196ADE02|nr:transport and Golgi organization protein 1 homolog [Pteropus giganteus]